MHEKKSGGQTALSLPLEEIIFTALDSLTNRKVPFDRYDIRCLVKSYLDMEKLQIKQFKNNFPGVEWLRLFIKRNNLTKHITDMLKLHVQKLIAIPLMRTSPT